MASFVRLSLWVGLVIGSQLVGAYLFTSNNDELVLIDEGPGRRRIEGFIFVHFVTFAWLFMMTC